MLRKTCWSVLMILAAAAASGKDYPLQFKTLSLDKAMLFPGAPGAFAELRLNRPAELKNEPKAVSKHPVYGCMGNPEQGTRYLFRLDESKGDGKGYDQLTIDLNQNNDLTDDAVTKKYAPWFGERRSPSTTRELVRFGPIEAPASKMIGKARPIYYAQAYVYKYDAVRRNAGSEDVYMGYLRFKPGWYLETTVEVGNQKQKLGLIDSDANMRLGQLWICSTSRSREAGGKEVENWYFQTGDSLLVDLDGSGKFDNDQFFKESFAFSPILYVAGQAQKVTFATDYRSIQVEPWPEALAELSLQPQGAEVRCATLGWEKSAGQWQLISPTVNNGKLLVPPGNYRLYNCTLAPRAKVAEQIAVVGMNQRVTPAVLVERGKENRLACGAPLQIKVTAQNTLPSGTDRITTTNYFVRINAEVTGQGGEMYFGYGKGKDFSKEPPPPKFTVSDAQGKVLASGDLEYG